MQTRRIHCIFLIIIIIAGSTTPVRGFKLSIKPLHGGVLPKNQTEKLDPDEYWDMIVEDLDSPAPPPSGVKVSHSWFDNALPEQGYVYGYGGKTAYALQTAKSSKSIKILAMYLDDREYSGITLSLGRENRINFEPYRSAPAAGIGFWCKGRQGGESVYFGLLDDDTDGKKVHTKIALRDFGKIDTAWRYFTIPLKQFQAKGKYWSEARKSEILSDIDWKTINEVRFSVNRGENKNYDDKPVSIFVSQIALINDIPGYIDPDDYWKTFSSDAPDLLLHDFEGPTDTGWYTGTGPASKATAKLVPSRNIHGGKRSLAITYQLNDWCDVMFDYRTDTHSLKRDWTNYWGIKLTVQSDKAYQALNIQISDAGNELYIASCGAPAGCNELIIPFRDFSKFAYYQPPNARHDGTFDRDGILMFDIKPSGEGTDGTFLIDNITLTNDRTVEVQPVASVKHVRITGNFDSVVTESINEGIFGINAQHWDSDLLTDKTAEFVKPVGHKVIRFPGGLSADEYHWKTMLDAKDANVDIDEFMTFCRQTGCEPMLTVNFGTGTPQEAAAWVRYCNSVKRYNVRYWEVGNELYGNWHKNHCTAEEYGKRAVEFIKAMKNVDPSIVITVVWELESPWNKTIFDYTKDIADGINVHNYPQESGEEHDQALLASPQALLGIVARIRRQCTAYGVPGKKYGIWLTEWNSVDFNPGPQALGMVNALFVADYLGELAVVNIEQASYWNIHNSMFVEGGDYGYLSRSDVPEGANVPRPSYWAFRMAAEHIRGKLVLCTTDDINVTAYAAVHPDGSKHLLIINKNLETELDTKINISGFSGNAAMARLTKESGREGYVGKEITQDTGHQLRIPPGSITALILR